MPVREDSRDGVERFSVSGEKERWLEFLSLEHATLAPPLDFSREDGTFLVARAPVPGRRIRDGRIPTGCGAPLFLQACAAASFLQASGLWLDEEDLCEAVWDVAEGTPRLWLVRSPASLSRGGPGPAAAPILAGFLDRLFSRRRRIEHPAARGLFDRLLATDAAYRRAEFWLSSAFRDFPELGSREAAGARARTLGSGGGFLRTPGRRAMAEKARALLGNRAPRIFAARDSFTPGGALGLEQPVSAARAARALRERHAAESRGRRAVWIAVDTERWDALSRRAFETAAAALGEEVETVLVPAAPPPPLMPDEWRREIFVPCGTLNASLRFYDDLASLAREAPSRARDLAETAVRSLDWAAFGGDPTGDAPLPAMQPPVPAADGCAPSARASIALSRSRRPGIRGRLASGQDGPGRRIELLIAAGRTREALLEAQRWKDTFPRGPAEPWFELSARLAGVARERLPPRLEALEAGGEISGGPVGAAGN